RRRLSPAPRARDVPRRDRRARPPDTHGAPPGRGRGSGLPGRGPPGARAQIVESVRLQAAQGLAHWLATQGRPARVHELTDPAIVRELKLLQSVLAVPLLAHGELVAILVVGQPVVGSTYGRRETETLFDLATHL